MTLNPIGILKLPILLIEVMIKGWKKVCYDRQFHSLKPNFPCLQNHVNKFFPQMSNLV